jgi:hypothetical protein
MLFSCDICKFYTSNRYDYKKHIQTKKHIANCNLSHLDNTENHNDETEENDNSTIVNEIVLNITDKSNIPKRRYNGYITPKKITHVFNKVQTCKYCGIGYSYSSGLSRHMKTCNGTIPEQSQITSPNDANVMNMISTFLQENVVFKQMIVDVVKNQQELIATQQESHNKLIEICKNNTNNAASVTNNIYNHKGDNNHFSINLFLNEKCKGAMNMTDFVKSIDLTTEDMEHVGRHGYVKGISSIFIDNLKNTDIHKRPIHCTDRKREILYVKEHDKWEREDINSQKMIDAVRTVEHKNINLINEWAKKHPECEKSYTRANDVYMTLSRHAQDGEDYNITKVIKNIAKETVIERNS